MGYGFRKHNILYLPNDGGGWKRFFPFQWDESQVPVISFGVKSWYILVQECHLKKNVGSTLPFRTCKHQEAFKTQLMVTSIQGIVDGNIHEHVFRDCDVVVVVVVVVDVDVDIDVAGVVFWKR